MTKKDVYVVVDTPKKAKKLKKLLDMFNEPMYLIPRNERSSHNGTDYGWGYGFSNGQWQGFNTKSAIHNGKQFKKVSIKELRNILAKENLKEGDYVVCEDSGEVAVGIFKYWDSHFGFDLDNCHYKDGSISESGGCFENFKRYATPEEIALLEPKPKELVVGKWYKDPSSAYLVRVTKILGKHNYVEVYGFDCKGVWVDKWDTTICKLYREATAQEVESALIDEANRRYKVVDIISDANGVEIVPNGCYVFKEGVLYYGGTTLMKNGKWAEVIDKFAELKEAHKNGAVIQVKSLSGDWIIATTPSWQYDYEYRIKPEDKKNINEDYSVYNLIKDSDIATIEALHDVLLDNHKYDLNSKLLTNARELCKKLQNIKGGN